MTNGRTPEASPIACNLSPEHAEEWGREMTGLVTELEAVRELEDGYALGYAGDGAWEDRLRLLAEFIRGERKCCPFLRFELILEAEAGPMWLRLRGRPGVKEYLARELVEAYGLDGS